MKDFFNNVVTELQNRNIKFVKQIHANFNEKLCPELQFITLDALEKKDYPHNIAENSIFICFEIDLKNKKIEILRTGHVYLSESDQKSEKYKYLCMKSIRNILKDNGCKVFRKQAYKNENDLCNKIEKFFVSAMEQVEKYTGGYPYKQGI